VPDLVLQLDRITLIVDAKYKRHWEELQSGGWHEQSEVLRDEHRQDLMQVLAYANLAVHANVICCLIYPCSEATWKSLADRGRLFHRAELANRGRRVTVWLTAIPMCAQTSTIVGPLAEEIQRAQREHAAA